MVISIFGSFLHSLRAFRTSWRYTCDIGNQLRIVDQGCLSLALRDSCHHRAWQIFARRAVADIINLGMVQIFSCCHLGAGNLTCPICRRWNRLAWSRGSSGLNAPSVGFHEGSSSTVAWHSGKLWSYVLALVGDKQQPVMGECNPSKSTLWMMDHMLTSQSMGLINRGLGNISCVFLACATPGHQERVVLITDGASVTWLSWLIYQN